MPQRELKQVNMKSVPSEFEFGKEVYVVLGPEHWQKGQVTAYRSWVINDANNIVVFPKEARLSIFTLSDYFEDIEEDAVPFKYLTDSRKEIARWIAVHKVNFSDEEWVRAIGKRATFEEIKESVKNHDYDTNESIEESELGVCCANLSSIRDVLTKCWENKGLIGWEVERLQWLCDNSCHDFPEDAPTLKKILETLNVNWS